MSGKQHINKNSTLKNEMKLQETPTTLVTYRKQRWEDSLRILYSSKNSSSKEGKLCKSKHTY